MTFTLEQEEEGEEEELLAIDQGRSHTSSPRSRPSSRHDGLLTDMARSQEETARSTKEQLHDLARSHRPRRNWLNPRNRNWMDELVKYTKRKLVALVRG